MTMRTRFACTKVLFVPGTIIVQPNTLARELFLSPWGRLLQLVFLWRR